MLWHKAWVDTRWRFLIGLGLLICSAAATVLTYPYVAKLLPLAPVNIPGTLGRRVRESIEIVREYRGYLWLNWFGQNLSQWASIFAVLLGIGGFSTQRSGTLFTLSLPVSRARLVGVRSATGLVEVFAIVFIPSLVIPLLSPSIGESYGAGSALVHAACVFVFAAVFFSFALLLSTILGDLWRPLLIALVIGALLAIANQIAPHGTFNVIRIMNGESYFRRGEIPWAGLFAGVAASAALLYGAVRTFAQREY